MTPGLPLLQLMLFLLWTRHKKPTGWKGTSFQRYTVVYSYALSHTINGRCEFHSFLTFTYHTVWVALTMSLTITVLWAARQHQHLMVHTEQCLHARLWSCSVRSSNLTSVSDFLTCRCWWCPCFPPAQVEESKEGESEGHEPCADIVVYCLLWQTGWGDHLGSQALQGKLSWFAMSWYLQGEAVG